MDCCGQRLTTNFCPTCGKDNPDRTPLIDLIDHCRRTAASAKKEADKLAGHIGEEGRSEPSLRRIRKMLDGAMRKCENWSSWAEQIQKLIDAGGN